MDPTTFFTHHLVKSEDLNHHGTLYAGRTAEWFVESGFIAVANYVPPRQIVCMQIHGMLFTRPINLGEVVCFESKLILTGRSRMVTHINVMSRGDAVVSGFITFINVDAAANAQPHGIEITPVTPEDIALAEQARALPRG